MRSIKKITMYVVIDENNLSDYCKEELKERIADGESKSEVLDILAETEVDLDLSNFVCDAKRWQNVDWCIDNITEKDYEDDTFIRLRERIAERYFHKAERTDC